MPETVQALRSDSQVPQKNPEGKLLDGTVTSCCFPSHGKLMLVNINAFEGESPSTLPLFKNRWNIEDFDARKENVNCVYVRSVFQYILMLVNKQNSHQEKIPRKMRILFEVSFLLFICFILLRRLIVAKRILLWSTLDFERKKGSHGKIFYLKTQILLLTVFHRLMFAHLTRWWQRFFLLPRTILLSSTKLLKFPSWNLI